jgi:hypothetical protein
MRGRPKGWLGLGLAAQSGGEMARGAVRGARRCSGVLADGLVVSGRRQGVAGEITGVTRRASGKVVGAELTREAAQCGGGG